MFETWEEDWTGKYVKSAYYQTNNTYRVKKDLLNGWLILHDADRRVKRNNYTVKI